MGLGIKPAIRLSSYMSILAASSCFIPAALAQRVVTPDTSDQDIIVTAQRRSERLQDVALSITSKTGEDLVAAGVNDLQAIQNIVPGLRFDKFGAYTQPAMRGISTLVAQPGAEANIAIYIDGVYQPSMVGNTFELPDISRVEVLKGPQGTLFGRNASGGAIQLFTLDPDLETASGNATLSYGTLNDVMAKGFASVPLVEDKAALSVSGFFENRDSYNHNIANNGRQTAGLQSRYLKAKLLLEPSSDVRIALSAFYNRRRDYQSFEGQPINGNVITRNAPGVLIPDDYDEVSFNPSLLPSLRVKHYGGSLKGDFDLGFAKLAAISAYGRAQAYFSLDRDVTNINTINFFIHQPEKYWSQELNLVSTNDGPLKWVVGAYLFNFNTDGYTLRSVGAPIATDRIFKTFSYSAFSEVNYDLSNALTLIVGGRYTSEHKTRYILSTGVKTGDETYHDFTPRLSARYRLSDVLNVYATYSRGVKTGVFDNFGLGVVAPEHINSYEAGLKGALPGLRFNAAVFRYEYKNLQVQSSQNNIPLLTNAAQSRIYGFDADVEWKIVQALSFTGGVTYLHARYRDFPLGIVNVPVAAGGNVAVSRDLSGNTNVRAPKWHVVGGLTYAHETNAGKITLSTNASYSTRYFIEAGNRIAQPGYESISARAAWRPLNSRFTFAIWGRNLTDSHYEQSSNIGTSGDTISYAPPRQVGVEVAVAL